MDKKTDPKSILSDIEKTLDTYLITKSPAIPADIKRIIVKILPYLVALGLIISAFGLFVYFAVIFHIPIISVASPAFGEFFLISFISLITNLTISVLALPGLFKQKRQGWFYLFIGSLISIILNIVTINIIGIIFAIILGFYPLFQIKEYYK